MKVSASPPMGSQAMSRDQMPQRAYQRWAGPRCFSLNGNQSR
jgi:hypothetical protein